MKRISSLIILLLLFSCNESKIPDYVIPKDDMTNILIDIHITDGLLTIGKVRNQLAKEDSINYYDSILGNYGYTRHDFDTSVYYYSLNINQYDEIYHEVLNKLNELETSLKEEEQEQELPPIQKEQE